MTLHKSCERPCTPGNAWRRGEPVIMGSVVAAFLLWRCLVLAKVTCMPHLFGAGCGGQYSGSVSNQVVHCLFRFLMSNSLHTIFLHGMAALAMAPIRFSRHLAACTAFGSAHTMLAVMLCHQILQLPSGCAQPPRDRRLA